MGLPPVPNYGVYGAPPDAEGGGDANQSDASDEERDECTVRLVTPPSDKGRRGSNASKSRAFSAYSCKSESSFKSARTCPTTPVTPREMLARDISRRMGVVMGNPTADKLPPKDLVELLAGFTPEGPIEYVLGLF
eukprot:1121846-Prorocentrum_minimum.AAC.1